MKLVLSQNVLNNNLDFTLPTNHNTKMNYDKKFGYYNPKTKKGVVYDGSMPTLTNTIVNGKPGFTIPKIFDGKCSKTQFDRMLTN